MFRSPIPFKGQKYDQLKKECLKKGELFKDPEFPANNKSLFFSKYDEEIEWKRPKELCKVPRLVVEGASGDDVNQGELGNAWFVSACSSLARVNKLWQKVVPNHKEQEWSQQQPYAGIFHFNFWRYGEWVDVVIDDLLPTRNGQLIFCHSKSSNEFWSALLEKAYAKLYGDYESLSSGCTADAIIDFSGGVPEKLELANLELNEQDQQIRFFEDLADAMDNHALITCTIVCSKEELGQETEMNLIKGHSYGITSVKKVSVAKSLQGKLGSKELYLFRLRSPFDSKEWNGPWSDDSPEWNSITHQDREKMGIVFEKEGEFWMALEDLIKNFTKIDICHFINTSFFSLKKTFSESVFRGEWISGAKGTNRDRAGGSDNHPDSCLYNPQYVFDITNAIDTVMFTLEQDDVHADKRTGAGHLKIGFFILKVQDNRRYRMNLLRPKVDASPYEESRSVFLRTTLNKGRYVLIPSTFAPNINGRFLLRFYTSSGANAKELTEDCPKSGCCSKGYGCVTSLKLVKAEGLEKKEGKGINAFAVIKCENESVKSESVKDRTDPQWTTEAIFYKKKVDKPIVIEIWSQNMLKNDFLGQANIHDRGTEQPQTKQYELYGKKKEAEIMKPGKITIELTSSDDLTDL